MRFSRLRLSGFKSFVEATDFRIEPGLTGVVGPNGCGKSNLLEALRWVMGANSAKALRGEGMDDVIFSGSAGRPPRNHAEVTLTIDNAEFDAPAGFNTAQVLEVSRRIVRGEGSQFRINGREVRARDVQLVFADASTGANSPALVRQGQISELIAARPQNRRRILEEAAGVSGLHSRRHEVELRVRAAETNLARLDDVLGEVETNLGRLRRESRQAERFRRLGQEIRALQTLRLEARWRDAAVTYRRLETESLTIDEAVRSSAAAAAGAMTAALGAQARIGPLRDEEAAAAAILHHLSIDQDRLERALDSAAAEAARLKAELARIDDDADRETQIIADAARELDRIETEATELMAELASGEQRLPHLRTLSAEADSQRALTDEEVEVLAAQIAADEASDHAAQTRLREARTLLARVSQRLAQAESAREALAAVDLQGLARATESMSAARGRLEAAQAGLKTAELALAGAAEHENLAHEAARSAEYELGRLVAEARGLAGAVAAAAPGGYPTALSAVVAPPELTAAVAAALGDDLGASLDERALLFWRRRKVDGPLWPPGVKPLGPMISAPQELAAALAFTGLVERGVGEQLQRLLPPGARLVSLEGDLWRWDGFTARAEATRPSQARLEQKSRLDSIEARIEALRPALAAAKSRHAEAIGKLSRAQATAREARAAPAAAEMELAQAKDEVRRLEAEQTLRESRVQSLDEAIVRSRSERDEAANAVLAADRAAALCREQTGKAARLAAARATADIARERAFSARTKVDLETQAQVGRQQRLDALRDEKAGWRRRAHTAGEHQVSLAADRQKSSEALTLALAAPEALGARREALADSLAAAEARKTQSSDQMAQAESARAELERRSRAADAEAATARELRASTNAHLEAARERLAEISGAGALEGVSPPDFDTDAEAPDFDFGAVDLRLASLEQDRESLGAVNLRAEEEERELADRAMAMRAERADLAGALTRLCQGLENLNQVGRQRLIEAFEVVNDHFQTLFRTLFEGGQSELRLVEADDPLEAGLEIFACPPGKRMAVMSLMSGGEQALTAVALIFAVFMANPAPVCFLDEVDAPLDDANVERFCALLRTMSEQTSTRFVAITHNPLTMARLDRLFGVTMPERGVSQLVSVDLRQAEALAAQ